ncbi:hypothetical protein JCM8097_009083 [Rhodosporidiobolus ruineniae]
MSTATSPPPFSFSFSFFGDLGRDADSYFAPPPLLPKQVVEAATATLGRAEGPEVLDLTGPEHEDAGAHKSAKRQRREDSMQEREKEGAGRGRGQEHRRSFSSSPPPQTRRRSPATSTDRWPITSSASCAAYPPPPYNPYTSFTSRNLTLPLSTLQAGLTFSDYAPYFTPSRLPIDPSRSLTVAWTQMRFLLSLSPRERWSSRPSAAAFAAPIYPSLAWEVMELEPDKDELRRRYPLGRLDPPHKMNVPRWEGMAEVLRWIWGPLEDKWANVAWAAQELPTPLVALLRQHADNSRYRTAVFFAWQECTSSLLSTLQSTTSAFTPRERRARALVRWLKDGGEVRMIGFFCDEEGRARRPEGTRESWEWWFDELERERVVEELDAWERSQRERRRTR